MNDVIRSLYSYLQARFGSPAGACEPGALCLAFERFGIGLTAADFKLQPTDQAFNPAIAAQHGALLVDFVAQPDSAGFLMPHGDLAPTITGQYEQLLTSACYGSRPASDAMLKRFLQTKARARRIFDQSQVAINLAHCYWPTSFVPALWFDDKNRTIWSSYSSSTGESLTADWSWRVLTRDAAPNLDLLRRLQATPAPQRHSSYLYETQLGGWWAAATSLRPGLNPIMAASAAFNSLVSSLPVQPTSSKKFELSLQYCVANISRPWLSEEFLTAAGAQRFTYLPTKLVIVKDLTLRAHWSEQDRVCARNSASLGPFSLLNTQFANDVLRAPGMQIIAWFCQVVPTPTLPPPPRTRPAIYLSTH